MIITESEPTKLSWLDYVGLSKNTASDPMDALARWNAQDQILTDSFVLPDGKKVWRRLPCAPLIDLIHANLGLTGELVEIDELVPGSAQLHEELGDVCWYVALGIRAVLEINGGSLEAQLPLPVIKCPHFHMDTDGLSWAHLFHRAMGNRLTNCISRFTDTVKRHLFYGAKQAVYFQPPDQETKALEDIYVVLLRQLCAIVGTANHWLVRLRDDETALQGVLAANIRKLAARYPEKFKETAALDRDLGKEAAALAGNA